MTPLFVAKPHKPLYVNKPEKNIKTTMIAMTTGSNNFFINYLSSYHENLEHSYS